MGDIADVIGGGTPRTSEPENFEGGDIPWVTPADLSGYTDKFISRGARFITQRGLESSSARVLPAGTVLFTSRAPIGYVAIAAKPIATNQGFKSFVLRPGVLPEYVYWWLRGAKRRAEFLASGTTFLELSGANAKKLPIPLVNLEEQRRIVAEIEKQFSRLDEAVANLQPVKTKLKRYTAAVLQSAINGELVRSPEETDSVQLKSLIGKISQGWSPRCDLTRDPTHEEWAVVTTTAVQPMQYVDNQGKALPPEFDSRPNLEIREGDFLMTRKGPRKRAGVACLVRNTRPRLMVCDTVYRFRCDTAKVVPGYLELALNAPSIVDSIDRHKAGINESGVSLTHSKLGGVLIPVPPIGAQSSIVAEVDRRLSIVREVEAEVVANLKRAQALRQAVLSKAFRSP